MPNVQDALAVVVDNSAQITATFAATTDATKQLTNNVYCAGNSFIGVQVPSTFTASNLSFFSSLTASLNSYYEMTDEQGDLISISTAAAETLTNVPANNIIGTPAGIQIPLDPSIFSGIQNLVVYSSAAQNTPQNIQLVMAPVLG